VTRRQNDDSIGAGSGTKILSVLALHLGECISGAELSKSLNISRTAVWKQVNILREKGYGIIAEASRGYRLVSKPDILTSAEIISGLHFTRIGRRIICLNEPVSTNSAAFKMASEGAEEGTVVIAESQSGGKGRLGRRWASPPGVNLYCSIILRPPVQPVNAPQLTFLSAVAVAKVIERLTPIMPRIKWPNDILVSGKKVAGLLNEMSAETDKINFVVLGIGVNLNMTAEQFPDDLRNPATSLLLEWGKVVNRVDFARCMLEELDSLYQEFLRSGFSQVRHEWLERSRLEGEPVTVADGGRELRGRVRGIDEYGALLIEDNDGDIQQVLSGDVSIG
jgi:BirA family biotin operon repressor/biotin-[acetyl-CoA-carboxylase] ligase